MYILHEGEIVLKEKYSSTLKERFYIKPPDQTNIVVLDESPTLDFNTWLTKIFLPQGYPGSVSKDYLQYQFWDTAQAFCSTIAGTLATQEVLRGVGVGDSEATPLAATMTWLFKDGCGHIARIVFAYTHGTQLDAFCKTWRLYADVLNDVAMCIEISMPAYSNHITLALCISTMLKAVVGVAGGATRLVMTEHHAIRANMADVSAKDSAQETAVNLVASVMALFVINIFGSSIPIFILMIIFHISCNYMAVRSVCLHTLNEPRFLQVINDYLQKELIPIPCLVNRIEPLVLYDWAQTRLDTQTCGFKIKLGCSLKNIVRLNRSYRNMIAINKIYDKSQYILYPNINTKEMYVLIKDEADVEDILCSYFHAVLLSLIISAINEVPLAIYMPSEEPRPFAEICHTLQAADWSRDPRDTVVSANELQHNASYDLMRYLMKTVQKEWDRTFAEGLKETGWDISRHHLSVEEWRISTHDVGLEAPLMSKPSFFTQSHFDLVNKSFLNVIFKEEKTDKGTETYTIEPDTALQEAQKSSKTVMLKAD